MRLPALLDAIERLLAPRSPRTYVVGSLGPPITRRAVLVGTAGFCAAALVARSRLVWATTREHTPHIVFGGPIVRDSLVWSARASFPSGLSKSDLDRLTTRRLTHHYSAFAVKKARRFRANSSSYSTVHDAALIVDPLTYHTQSKDGTSGTALAMPASPRHLLASHPANNQVDADAEERWDRIERLFAPANVEPKVEAMEAVKKGDVASAEYHSSSVHPEPEKNETLIVTPGDGTNLRCSYHKESLLSGKAPCAAQLMYVGRRSNWVQVVAPWTQSADDRGYRWVDARNLGVDVGNGKVVAMKVFSTPGDTPGGWDGDCHVNRAYCDG